MTDVDLTVPVGRVQRSDLLWLARTGALSRSAAFPGPPAPCGRHVILSELTNDRSGAPPRGHNGRPEYFGVGWGSHLRRTRHMRIRRAHTTPKRGPATGDRGAPRTTTFDAEALSHVDSLYRTALRLTRAPADAEDLVQETYLKAFRAAGSFEPGTNLRAWLFTILHNTVRNRFRDRARDGESVDTEMAERAADASVASEPGGPVTPETLLLRETLGPELQAAVDALPEAFRQVVWLRDVEEFSYAEIANMLDVPLGTVMSRLSRARRMLFDRLHHLKPANV